jgi:hypothetical protein
VEHQEPTRHVRDWKPGGVSGRLQRFVVFALELLAGVLLVFVKEFGVKADVAGFVDTVDISETSRDGEVGSDFSEIAVYIPDILWLSIQRGIVNASIIDTYLSIPLTIWRLLGKTIFFTTGDSDFHFEPLFHGDGALKVFLGQFDVFLLWFLREIDHVRAMQRMSALWRNGLVPEKRVAVFLEVFLILIQHSIEPRK